MRKGLLLALPFFLALFACTGGTGNDPNTPYTPPGTYTSDSYFWGSWSRMDTGEKWYIADSSAKIYANNGYETSTCSITAASSGEAPSITISRSVFSASDSSISTLGKQSDNVIEGSSGSKKFLLYRSTGANLDVQGRIVGFTGGTGSRGLHVAGLGSLDVLIKNKNNGASTQTAKSDDEGVFTVSKIVAGDPLEVSVTPPATVDTPNPKPVTIVVTPDYATSNLGNIAITDPEGFNFKTTFSFDDDAPYAYSGQSRAMTISITNVGKADCEAATYSITPPAGIGLTVKGSDTPGLFGILGTVEGTNATAWDAVHQKKLNFNVYCEPFVSQYQDKDIPILITDPTSGKVWEDHIVIRFYGNPTRLYIKAKDNPLNGFIISPENRSFRFTVQTQYESYIDIPYWAEGQYSLVFSGATAATETLYSFRLADVNSSLHAGEDWAAQTATAELQASLITRYKSNITEQSAYILQDSDSPYQDHYSYIYKNKIDYFKFSMSSIPGYLQPNLPQTVTFAYSGANASIQPGAEMTVQASIASPANLTVDSWQWYLLGVPIPGATGSSVTVGGSDAEGKSILADNMRYRLTPIAICGSSSYSGEPGLSFFVSSSGWHSENVSLLNYSSPDYPNDYPNAYAKTWTISRTGMAKMKLHFIAFDTEAGCDFVHVYKGSDTSLPAANLLATYSGKRGAFTTEEFATDSVIIKFTSDTSSTFTGWKIDSVQCCQE